MAFLVLFFGESRKQTCLQPNSGVYRSGLNANEKTYQLGWCLAGAPPSPPGPAQGKICRTIDDRYVSHEGREWHSLFFSWERVANKRVYSPTAGFTSFETSMLARGDGIYGHPQPQRRVEDNGNDLVALEQILGHENLNTTAGTSRTQGFEACRAAFETAGFPRSTLLNQ
jgi:hypothetical protein